MAPAASSNWLSFSLSPMEYLANSVNQTPQILPTTLAPHQYYFDSLYSPDWSTQKAGMYGDYVVEQGMDNNHHHNPTTVPKLEDFFGDHSSNNHHTASYNSQQTNDSTTQDSSSQLTHFYESSHQQHNVANNYFTDHHEQPHHNNHQDLKAAMGGGSTGFGGGAAFSGNSGSEVDDSGSIVGRTTASTQLACAEYVGQSIENEMVQGFNSAATTNHNTTTASTAVNGGSLSLAVVPQNTEKAVVCVASNENDGGTKKVADTFGQRTSIYRGVTRHRWTGRYEAHLWDNSCRREGQARKGRQVYLGGYDKEDKAARAYDLAALKYWGPTATTNFPTATYTKEIEDMKLVTKQEFIASLRRKSSGFSRGASIYRGVTRHHQQGRWQARIGRVAGNKDLYLGTFATEEEAAEAYDIAAIKFRGINAVTNFEMNRYDVEAILNSNLPIGGAAKRLKLATEALEHKPTLSLDQQSHSSNGSSGNSSTINFAAIQPVPPMSCAVPFDTATAYFHQNLLQHLNSNGGGQVMTSDAYGANAVTAMSLMPQTPAEFYLWPNQTY